MEYKDAVFQDASLQLRDGDRYEHCSFTRIIFEGEERKIRFLACMLDDCVFPTPLVHALVSGCRILKTHLRVAESSTVSKNAFLGEGALLSVELRKLSLKERIGGFLSRHVPLLDWLLWKLGLRLPVGAVVSGNWFAEKNCWA